MRIMHVSAIAVVLFINTFLYYIIPCSTNPKETTFGSRFKRFEISRVVFHGLPLIKDVKAINSWKPALLFLLSALDGYVSIFAEKYISVF